MPHDLADDDRKRWADIAFRGMSALKKAGIDYSAKPPTTCYQEVQPRAVTMKGDRILGALTGLTCFALVWILVLRRP